MKLTVISNMDEDYQMGLVVKVDDVEKFNVYDGEPEDNCLGRNFNACYKIADMMRMAYEAGKRGESFDVENIEEGF